MKICVFTLLNLLILTCFSQNCKIIGKIMDYETGEPIPYANAILKSAQIGRASCRERV